MKVARSLCVAPHTQAAGLIRWQITVGGECSTVRKTDLTTVGVTGKNDFRGVGNKGV
jgi:hypothetical protein